MEEAPFVPISGFTFRVRRVIVIVPGELKLELEFGFGIGVARWPSLCRCAPVYGIGACLTYRSLIYGMGA